MTDVELWPEWTQSVQKVKRLDSAQFRVGISGLYLMFEAAGLKQRSEISVR